MPGLGMIRCPPPAPWDRKPAFGISPSKAGKARAHGHRARAAQPRCRGLRPKDNPARLCANLAVRAAPRAAQPRCRGLRPKDNPARLCATLAVRVGPCVNKV